MLDFMKCREREYREKRENTRFMWFGLTAYIHRAILDGYIFTILSIHLITINPK